MGTVTKKALVDHIAESTGQKRVVVKRTVQEFLDLIIVELAKGNRLEFRDFGVFELKERAARVAQNPKTLERVPVPAKKTVKFKVGRKMREVLDASTPEPVAASGVRDVEVHVNTTSPEQVKPRSRTDAKVNHTTHAGA